VRKTSKSVMVWADHRLAGFSKSSRNAARTGGTP
jgi:hypothetical protein